MAVKLAELPFPKLMRALNEMQLMDALKRDHDEDR
jgi:hypothetical protein